MLAAMCVCPRCCLTNPAGHESVAIIVIHCAVYRIYVWLFACAISFFMRL